MFLLPAQLSLSRNILLHDASISLCLARNSRPLITAKVRDRPLSLPARVSVFFSLPDLIRGENYRAEVSEKISARGSLGRVEKKKRKGNVHSFLRHFGKNGRTGVCVSANSRGSRFGNGEKTEGGMRALRTRLQTSIDRLRLITSSRRSVRRNGRLALSPTLLARNSPFFTRRVISVPSTGTSSLPTLPPLSALREHI